MKHIIVLFSALILCNLIPIQAEIDCYGAAVEVTVARSSNNSNSFEQVIVVYGYPSSLGVPLNETSTAPLHIELPQPADACVVGEQNITPASVDGAAALTIRGNCSFNEKLQALHAAGYSSMILYNNGTDDDCVFMSGDENSTDIIPLYAVSLTSTAGSLIQSLLATPTNESYYVILKQPEQSMFDPAEVLLWCLAVSTVTIAAFWAGAIDAGRLRGLSPASRRAHGSQTSDEGAAEITVHAAMAFVFVSSAVLLLLFFFFNKWLALFLVVMFTLIGWQATADVLDVVFTNFVFPRHLGTKSFNVHFLSHMPIPSLAATSLSAVLAVTWFACRHAHWSWIVQDTLSVCLMLVILKSIKIPNLKVAAILLPSALLYDVWWVFLQPMLIGGKSVMVEVATAGGPTERLPMLLAVPLFWGLGSNKALTILGLGDVVLPGLLVAFVRRWEVARGMNPLRYTVPTCAGYGAGLVATYFALAAGFGGQQGQPALLYLVPFTLGVVLVVAWRRREVGRMWECDLSQRSALYSDEEGADGGSTIDEGTEALLGDETNSP